MRSSGVEVSPRRSQDAAALAAFLPYVEALDFTDDSALHYAEIRADLKKRGELDDSPAPEAVKASRSA